LAGIYSNDDETGTPMERPDEFEGLTLKTITPEKIAEIVAERDRRFKAQVDSEAWRRSISPPPHLIFDTFDRNNKRPWLITDPEDGKIPARTAEANARPRTGGTSTNQNSRGPFNSYTDMGLYDRCITRGIPSSMMPAGYGSRYEIVQSPDTVAIRYEMIHEARVIPLDGAHVGAGVQMWMGDSRGRFEGDTLVIETTNFTNRTGLGGNGNGAVHSTKLKLVERLTRIDANTVRYEFTVNDSETYTQPWTVAFDLDSRPGYEIYEYACHEGNYGLANMLSAARAEERAAAEPKR
jgi:hypothetical protein